MMMNDPISFSIPAQWEFFDNWHGSLDFRHSNGHRWRVDLLADISLQSAAKRDVLFPGITAGLYGVVAVDPRHPSFAGVLATPTVIGSPHVFAVDDMLFALTTSADPEHEWFILRDIFLTDRALTGFRLTVTAALLMAQAKTERAPLLNYLDNDDLDAYTPTDDDPSWDL